MLLSLVENAFKHGAGEDSGSPKIAIDAVKNTPIEILEYSHSAGFESYRTKLANYYQKHNINVTKDEIIITTGGS